MTAAEDAVAAAFREQWGRVVATLIRVTGDWDLAEECAQEAFAVALQRWPHDGVPRNPGAWLTTTARNRAFDRLRRSAVGTRKLQEVARLAASHPGTGDLGGSTGSGEGQTDDESGIADDRLRLIFTCCHPALSLDARVGLTLRTLAGLTTAEIARAFVVSEETMAKRLVRAKHKSGTLASPIASPGVAPARKDSWRPRRPLPVVQRGLCRYLRGRPRPVTALRRSDPAGQDAGVPDASGTGNSRPPLADALARRPTCGPHRRLRRHSDPRRTGPDCVGTGRDRRRSPFPRQSCGLWARRPYQVQAAIVACHVTAADAAATDWAQVARLYGQLEHFLPSAVVKLNRAVAVAMADGPALGLALLNELERSGQLDAYHLLPATRADLLRRMGRNEEAAASYRQAIDLAGTDAERRFLLRRLGETTSPP